MGAWVGTWNERVVGQGMHIMYSTTRFFKNTKRTEKIDHCLSSQSSPFKRLLDDDSSPVVAAMLEERRSTGLFFCRPTTQEIVILVSVSIDA